MNYENQNTTSKFNIYNVWYTPGCAFTSHLHKSDVGPLVTATFLVEREKIWHRPLQELRIELVADVVDDDN